MRRRMEQEPHHSTLNTRKPATSRDGEGEGQRREPAFDEGADRRAEAPEQRGDDEEAQPSAGRRGECESRKVGVCDAARDGEDLVGDG